MKSMEFKVERVMAHELGHLYDRDLGNLSDNSPEFFPGGTARSEIEALAKTDGYIDAWFGNAMKAGRTPHRELFAQAFALLHFNPEVMREALPETYQYFKALGQRGSGGPTATGRAGLQGQAGGDQSVRAQALIAAAERKDPALFRELSTSTDAKVLQRADQALPPGEALDVVNARMTELVQDPDVAYGLQTKKYSLDLSIESLMPNEKNSSPDLLTDELLASVPLMRKENITGWKERFPSVPLSVPSPTLLQVSCAIYSKTQLDRWTCGSLWSGD